MILLAALIFGLITFGFALLTLLPVILLFLGMGVFLERSAQPEAASADLPAPASPSWRGSPVVVDQAHAALHQPLPQLAER